MKNFTYGEELKELLNRHKKVWVEEEERTPDGKFRRYTYIVGGNNE